MTQQYDLTDFRTLQHLLQQFCIRPDKKLSQNFLLEPDVLEEMIAASQLTKNDNVIEVGAGTGVLTQVLAAHAGKVVAVEIDDHLLPLLREVTKSLSNVTLVHADVMRTPIAALRSHFSSATAPYKVVANLPYHLTSHFLQRFLDTPDAPRSLTVLVQREVAERVAAEPGDMSLLALSVQMFGTPMVCAVVPAEAFWPAPKVESAILHVERHPKPLFDAETRSAIFHLAKMGFAGRRKTLGNALSAGLRKSRPEIVENIVALGLKPTVRAQELTLEQWRGLAGLV
ncbi:MAG: 16S rRNA (adenine(1518)-N(6)/adenine(1519)-N(6))-dimethyltransferase RsmA [Patescibacteria group bacterium]